jgi:hypothetical protein
VEISTYVRMIRSTQYRLACFKMLEQVARGFSAREFISLAST